MTTNQIAWMKNQETERANRAMEAENYRSNLAREQENFRSNVEKERENRRHNKNTEHLEAQKIKSTDEHYVRQDNVAKKKVNSEIYSNYVGSTGSFIRGAGSIIPKMI